MPSLVPNFEYDIFISYRHNDNRSGWVTEFVNALQEELASTIKEPLSIYFDKNPHDGLLETHHVDKSLEGKLKCLIFIPIISQTYCDTKSFAWQHEFVAFNKLAKEDQFGRDIKLSNGNVASRILPIKIHDLDAEDKATLETEIGAVLRAIEFIYKEAGVNRPLKPTDSKTDNQNKTDYRNQVNKVANAIKEIIYALTRGPLVVPTSSETKVAKRQKIRPITLVIFSVLLGIFAFCYFYFQRPQINDTTVNESSQILDRAEKNLEEVSRFDDKRYSYNAISAIRKVLAKDSLNERALYLMSMALENADSSDHYIKKIFRINPVSVYGLLARSGFYFQKMKYDLAIADLKKAETLSPKNKDALQMLSVIYLYKVRDYLSAWNYAKKYEQVSGTRLHELLSDLYLDLGDFKEARRQLTLKQNDKEFSCGDIESYQRILLCEGNFETLEKATDSICAITKCEKCPYWQMRAKMHVEKLNEAAPYVRQALKNYSQLAWRLPAFVLKKIGKSDSSTLLLQAELNFDKQHLNDTAFQSLPLYSLSAINAMQGNYKESIQWLRQYADKGFDGGSEWYITHDPLFDELKKDSKYFPDFLQVVQKAQIKKSTLLEKLRELERGQVIEQN